MAISIDADMRELYETWLRRNSKTESIETWQSFQGGWHGALRYAAEAREAERKWIADGRSD